MAAGVADGKLALRKPLSHRVEFLDRNDLVAGAGQDERRHVEIARNVFRGCAQRHAAQRGSRSQRIVSASDRVCAFDNLAALRCRLWSEEPRQIGLDDGFDIALALYTRCERAACRRLFGRIRGKPA